MDRNEDIFILSLNTEQIWKMKKKSYEHLKRVAKPHISRELHKWEIFSFSMNEMYSTDNVFQRWIEFVVKKTDAVEFRSPLRLFGWPGEENDESYFSARHCRLIFELENNQLFRIRAQLDNRVAWPIQRDWL